MITQTFASRSDRAAGREPRRRGALGVCSAFVLWTVLGVATPSRLARAEAPATPSARDSSSDVEAPSLDTDAWLEKLTSADAATRQWAVSALVAAHPAMVPAIAKRVGELARTADRDAMSAVIARARRAGGDIQNAAKSRDGGKEQGIDWFERVMAAAEPDHAEWRDLASVLGLSRLLVRIHSTAALRELGGIAAGFGEVVRADVERQILALGERALPPLIEIRRGESKDLRVWAIKMLEMLGKPGPGEAVQTADNQLLAEILRAYGRAKDAEAASIIVTFTNSERADVREAARDAVKMLAEVGTRQLRESYENFFGQRPPEDWPWDRIAAELFNAYDRSRLAEAYALMDEGLAARERRDWEAMASAFDRVLARAPEFERRREMVPGYLELARAVRKDRPRSMAMLRRVKHLDPTGPLVREAESELVYLQALELADRGIVDETAFRRAVDLNPENREAKEELRRINAASTARSAVFQRYLVIAAIALVSLAGAALALVWRLRSSPR